MALGKRPSAAWGLLRVPEPVSIPSAGGRNAVGSCFGRNTCAMVGALMLGGCAPAGAPALPFFGAYFPSWLLCAFIGILGAVILRLIFIRTGLDDVLPARLPVYAAIAAALGFLAALLAFGR